MVTFVIPHTKTIEQIRRERYVELVLAVNVLLDQVKLDENDRPDLAPI